MRAGPLMMPILALLSACAHKPVSMAGCDLPRTPLRTEIVRGAVASEGAAESAPEYEALLRGALDGLPGAVGVPQRPVLLFMSGGSQNGAFGAGLIDQWRVRGGGLPAFRVVTGVSTGSLLATPIFVGRSERAVAGYTIDSEADILKVEARGLIGIARKGAAGTLVPLRARLDAMFDSAPGIDDDALLGEVAVAADQHRKLLVGIVDLRGGDAWAVDMTALAQRWRDADAAAKPRVKRCYIETLIASSSVPAAAPPVYIDNVMYIDGGARFGLFRAAEERALRTARTGRTVAPLSLRVVNGMLETEAQCPFVTAKGAACPTTGTLRDWDFADSAQRAVKILTNQIYRFSAAAATLPGDPPVALIGPDAGEHLFAFGGETLTCDDWRARDNADKPAPVEFHKRQMRCLIDYGRARADVLKWWTL